MHAHARGGKALDCFALVCLQLEHHFARHCARDLDCAVGARGGDSVADIARALEAADGIHDIFVLLDLELRQAIGGSDPFHWYQPRP